MAWRKEVALRQQRSGRCAVVRGERDTLCSGMICESVREGSEARRTPGNQHNSRSSSSDSGSSAIETMIGPGDGIVALIATTLECDLMQICGQPTSHAANHASAA